MTAIGRAGVPMEPDPDKRCGMPAPHRKTCTRTAGHPGGHVAHGSRADDYWQQDETSRPGELLGKGASRPGAEDGAP